MIVQDKAVQVMLIRRVEDGGVETEGVQRQGEDKGMPTVKFETHRRDRARRVRQTLWENNILALRGARGFLGQLRKRFMTFFQTTNVRLNKL